MVMVTCRRQAHSTILMVMREILSFSPGGIQRGQAPSVTLSAKGGSEVISGVNGGGEGVFIPALYGHCTAEFLYQEGFS